MKKLSAIRILTDFGQIFHLPFYKYQVIKSGLNFTKIQKPLIELTNQLTRGDSIKIWFVEVLIKGKKEYYRYVLYESEKREILIKLNPVNKISFGYNPEFIKFWNGKGMIPQEIKIYQLKNKWQKIISSKLKSYQNKLTF